MLRLILGAKRRRANNSESVGDNKCDASNADSSNNDDDATDDNSDSDGSDVTSLAQDDPDTRPASDDDGDQDDDEAKEEDLETWVEWMKRSTRYVEEQLGKIRCDDWVSAYRRRKWRWAGQVARTQDNRWTLQVAVWMQDRQKTDVQNGLRRRQGRPITRWSDEIVAYLQEIYKEQHMEWTEIARDADTWEHLEEDFAKRTWKA